MEGTDGSVVSCNNVCDFHNLSQAFPVSPSLALLDHFFPFIFGRGKKGLVNVLYHSCSRDPQFLGVVD